MSKKNQIVGHMPTVADILWALGDEVRLPIVKAVATKAHTVSELVEVTGHSIQSVTQHLDKLQAMGIITRSKFGKNVNITRESAPILQAIKELQELVK